MGFPNKDDIYDALKGIAEKDKINGLHIGEDGHVVFSILVDPVQGTQLEDMRQKAEKSVASIKGIKQVTAVLTAEKKQAPATAPDPHGMNKNPKLSIPAKRIIAIASGKGGVGKSTIAVHIAVGLAATGKKIGLLDCDIYGPSIPTLTNLPLKKPEQDKDGKLIPFDAFGMKVMSIAFLVGQEAAMIWRGPMVQSAIYQMLRDTQWVGDDKEELDFLILDMPPGTGDAQLTIAQKIDVDGAIIISTPQDLALMDAVKAIEMFDKTDVTVMGVIENMSAFECENCGHENHPFGHDTVRIETEKRELNFLGSLPLDTQYRTIDPKNKNFPSKIIKKIIDNKY